MGLPCGLLWTWVSRLTDTPQAEPQSGSQLRTALHVGHTTAFFFQFCHFQQVIPQVRVPSDDGREKSNRAFDAVNKSRGAGLSLSCLQASAT